MSVATAVRLRTCSMERALAPVSPQEAYLFRAIGNFFSRLFGWILAPFAAIGRWYTRRGWILRVCVAAFLLLFVGLNAYFMVQTQLWSGFNPDYVAAYDFENRDTSAGAPLANRSEEHTSELQSRENI